MTSHTTLFSPTKLGATRIANRVVMAPMTRCRAIGNLPNALMAKQYAQRADAGLLITEGTAPSVNGVGYARIPGIYSAEQVRAWKGVTDAVHAKGGRIFMQLMHVGRVAHPDNMPEGGRMLAPSAIAAKGEMWTDGGGMQIQPVPEAMTLSQIEQAQAEFVTAARNAIEAGFDGIEMHAANGYLLDQFLNPSANQRTDAYGGDAARRNRFVLEITAKVADAIGADRVGIRLSPFGVFNDQSIFEGLHEQFVALAGDLSKLGLAYLHLVDHSAQGAPEVPMATKKALKQAFDGPVILCGGYEAGSAEVHLREGIADAIGFGRPFIANPDLVSKLRDGGALTPVDPETLYTPGEAGYLYSPRRGASELKV